jgi:hypothetical protein
VSQAPRSPQTRTLLQAKALHRLHELCHRARSAGLSPKQLAEVLFMVGIHYARSAGWPIRDVKAYCHELFTEHVKLERDG